MAQQTNVLPEFDTKKAAHLLFPERYVTDDFQIKFQENSVFVSLRNKYDLNKLMGMYQEAYFREQINNTKWLENKVSSIVNMCTDGCVPFLDFLSHDEWIPPETDITIPLKWLRQNLLLRYAGKISGNFYYNLSITDAEKKEHTSGNKILLSLALGESRFVEHSLKHIFQSMSYDTRLRVVIVDDDDNKALHIVKERVTSIASEIFAMIGEKDLPKWKENKTDKKNSRELVVQTDRVSKGTGSVNVIISLKSFVSSASGGKHKTLEVDFGLDLEHNQFGDHQALSQISGIEAMNLFLIRCKQLNREDIK